MATPAKSQEQARQRLAALALAIAQHMYKHSFGTHPDRSCDHCTVAAAELY